MPEQEESEIKRLILAEIGDINERIKTAYLNKAKDSTGSNRLKYLIIGVVLAIVPTFANKGWDAYEQRSNDQERRIQMIENNTKALQDINDILRSYDERLINIEKKVDQLSRGEPSTKK